MLAELEERLQILREREAWLSDLIGMVEDVMPSCRSFHVPTIPFEKFRRDLMDLASDADRELERVQADFDAALARCRYQI